MEYEGGPPRANKQGLEVEEEGKQAMSNTLTALPRNECLQIMDQVRIFLFLSFVFRTLAPLHPPLRTFPNAIFRH
jgi:uncharacterized protein (UPF0305 family)